MVIEFKLEIKIDEYEKNPCTINESYIFKLLAYYM